MVSWHEAQRRLDGDTLGELPRIEYNEYIPDIPEGCQDGNRGNRGKVNIENLNSVQRFREEVIRHPLSL